MTTSNTQKKEYTGDKPDFCTLRGVSMYAKVFQPSAYNEQYNIPARWEVDLLLTKTEAENAKSRGLNIRDDNDRYRAFLEENDLVSKGFEGAFIKIKKPTTRKKWDAEAGATVKDASGQPVLEAAPRPRVVDSQGTEIPEEAGLLVGNGSEVELTFIITKPKAGGREQFGKFGGRLVETKILELVEYQRPQGSFTFNSESTTEAESYQADMAEDEIPFLPDEE
jgi:hypothetical protein